VKKRFVPSLELVPRVLAGDPGAIARLMSRAESAHAECRDALARIYEHGGKAHVVGITGVPGSGKSTLVSVLATRLRARGGTVGIVAVDPSSPWSGGSIMGDRIRMAELAGDPGIFIRSMATRGALGGMARATGEAVDILDAAGFGHVLVETVGVGQDEVEIAHASHTTVVVSAPGLGDDIQAIKAGILEIADVHVVSKCDRSDANRTIADLKNMLAMGQAAGSGSDAAWRPPVVATSSAERKGIDALVDALDGHRAHLDGSEAGAARLRRIAEFRMLKTAEELLRDRFRQARHGHVADVAERLVRRQLSPYAAGEHLLDAPERERTWT
jgi:LAO/AO transport system kinase